MAQQSARRGWDNQGFPLCFEHAMGDLDPVRELPQAGGWLPAASKGRTDDSIRPRATTTRLPLRKGGRPQMGNRRHRGEYVNQLTMFILEVQSGVFWIAKGCLNS